VSIRPKEEVGGKKRNQEKGRGERRKKGEEDREPT
jgi:hypothetical protein